MVHLQVSGWSFFSLIILNNLAIIYHFTAFFYKNERSVSRDAKSGLLNYFSRLNETDTDLIPPKN